jgi:hypothetical protein
MPSWWRSRSSTPVGSERSSTVTPTPSSGSWAGGSDRTMPVTSSARSVDAQVELRAMAKLLEELPTIERDALLPRADPPHLRDRRAGVGGARGDVPRRQDRVRHRPPDRHVGGRRCHRQRLRPAPLRRQGHVEAGLSRRQPVLAGHQEDLRRGRRAHRAVRLSNGRDSLDGRLDPVVSSRPLVF